MERGCCATLFRNPLQDPLYVKAKPCTVTHSACENAALCTWCRASCRAAHGFATTPGSSFIPFIDVFKLSGPFGSTGLYKDAQSVQS